LPWPVPTWCQRLLESDEPAIFRLARGGGAGNRNPRFCGTRGISGRLAYGTPSASKRKCAGARRVWASEIDSRGYRRRRTGGGHQSGGSSRAMGRGRAARAGARSAEARGSGRCRASREPQTEVKGWRSPCVRGVVRSARIAMRQAEIPMQGASEVRPWRRRYGRGSERPTAFSASAAARSPVSKATSAPAPKAARANGRLARSCFPASPRPRPRSIHWQNARSVETEVRYVAPRSDY
jgi:hypothetical protein